MSGSTSSRQPDSPRAERILPARAVCSDSCTHCRHESIRASSRSRRFFLLGAFSGAASPPKPRASLSATRSMSSEKRLMSFQAFESEVPPLNVRCSPTPGRLNNSRSVQQTQKSFSTLTAWRRICASTCWQASRRSSGGRRRKASMDQVADLRSCRRMSAIQAGA